MKARFLFLLLSIAFIAKGQQPKVLPNKIVGDTIKDSIAVNLHGKLSPYKSYQGCTFLKSVQFVETIFPVDSQQTFNGTTFLVYANFIKAQFVHNANFPGAKFKGSLTFDFVKIHGNANFTEAQFKQPTLFRWDSIYQVADFTAANFYNDVDFWATTFNGFGGFEKVVFHKNVSFNTSNLKGDIVFSDATFYHLADFRDATFSKSVSFRELVLHDSTTFLFYNARLPEIIDLSHNANIPREIDLVTANFDSINGKPDVIHSIYLFRSDISKIHFDYIHFKLLFTDPDPFKEDKLTPDEIKSLYEQALKNFKDRGQEISFEKLDIEFHDYTWNYENIWWKKQCGKLIKWWWCYGYSKEKVFLHSACFVLLFTLLNFFILNLLQDVYNVSKVPKTKKLKLKGYGANQLLRRLWYSFAYTSTIFFSLSIKTEEIDFKHAAKSIYILFIYTLGLVCLAYMANFVLQK